MISSAILISNTELGWLPVIFTLFYRKAGEQRLVLGTAIQQVHSYSKSVYFPRDDCLGKPSRGFLQQLPPCHSMSPLIARATDAPGWLCPKTAAVPQQRNMKCLSGPLVFCNPWLTVTTVTGPFRSCYTLKHWNFCFVFFFYLLLCFAEDCHSIVPYLHICC